MTSSDGPDIDPRAVALYLGTLAGVAAFAWIASRFGSPRPNEWLGAEEDE